MGCGQIHLGGCEDPDLGHDGPCTINGVRNIYRVNSKHTRKLKDLQKKRSQFVTALSRLDAEIAAQEEKIALKAAWAAEMNAQS